MPTPDVYEPRAVMLPDGWQRSSVRPLEFREKNFDEEFDAWTLFYDAIWADQKVLLSGPPLHNLSEAFVGMTVHSLPSGTRTSYRFEELDLHMRLWIHAPSGTESVRLQTRMGVIDVPVQASEVERFRGLRVLQTMSKDNDIAWIQDWVRYHRDVHGADAVLLYDNMSSRYTAGEVLGRLLALEGLATVQVVSWPFRFGPQGFQHLGFWDSNYAQLGGYDHARWKYLSGAASVVNADVDELILTRRGQSVFDAVERSHSGVLRYRGKWVIDTGQSAAADRPLPRHKDYVDVLSPRRTWRGLRLRWEDRCPTKWTVNPARCPKSAQWHIHRIKGWAFSLVITRRVTYRHFRPLSTNWKYDRQDADAFDSRRHRRDPQLARAFDCVNWDG